MFHTQDFSQFWIPFANYKIYEKKSNTSDKSRIYKLYIMFEKYWLVNEEIKIIKMNKYQ